VFGILAGFREIAVLSLDSTVAGTVRQLSSHGFVAVLVWFVAFNRTFLFVFVSVVWHEVSW
jgi:hypothetical protein